MLEAKSPTVPDTSEKKDSFSSAGQAAEDQLSTRRNVSELLFGYLNEQVEETAFADQAADESLSLDFDPRQLIQDFGLDIDIKKTSEHFVALQKWEGYVTAVLEETFRARLIPMKGQGGDQEAEIFLQEIDEKDRELIEPGAVFYWSIGYDDRPSGRQRASRIRFRRLPTWSASEIAHAERDAERIKSLLEDGE